MTTMVHHQVPSHNLMAAREERMRELYAAHAGALRSFLLRLTFGERETAEDLVQETLLRAWRSVDVIAPGTQAARPWLFTVARRVAIDSARARMARPVVNHAADASTLPDRTDAIGAALNRQVLARALATLSADHRAVVIELYFRHQTAAAAAKTLGIPEGTVKSRMHYALRALRAAIGE